MAVERILINGVTEILKKLVPVVAQEIASAWGVKDELKRLQNTLEMILLVIADAERKQLNDAALGLWLRRLKDVAYDMDDLMDEFSYETMRRSARGNNFKYKAHDFVSSANPLAFDFKIARKIKQINQSLDEITKDISRFHLQTTPASNSDIPNAESRGQRSRETASSMNEPDIIGREDDKRRIVDLLTKVIPSSSTSSDTDPEKVSVVSIVGMGGLGKTSLAQLVYKDESVNKQFDLTMWVHVSEYFDVEKLLAKIMESLTQNKFDTLSNFDVLVSKVRNGLNGKRYLLVLDDLWNENADQWERLCSPLLVGAQGSKILITTRKTQVADVVMGSIFPYFLEKLQIDECWSIMERKAFSPGGALKTPNMINIGKEIANRCSGLPLAAKFLGSLMRLKNKESDWFSIRENIQEGQSEILTILKLSYDNLSPHLKQCFSYCSIFPKGWEIKRVTLIHLWMAEGFLKPSFDFAGNARPIEEIGEELFDSLVWSSFLDAVEKNELDDIITCKMHDLVHDLGRKVAGNRECAIVKISELDNISEIRRLQLITDEAMSTIRYKALSDLKKLRTVIVAEPANYNNMKHYTFSNKKLRVLHFGRLAEGRAEIPYQVAIKSKHLRYFHVSNLNLTTGFLRDQSISKLYHLQTLVLSGCVSIQNFLQNIGSLKNLRFLDISSSDIKELPESVTSLCNLQRLNLSHCNSLTTFPTSITGFQYLKVLDMSFTPIEELPGFIINLHNLQILDVNSCVKLKSLPEYVACLSNLRIFNFRCCPFLEVLPRDFGALTQLRSLDLLGTMITVLPEACGNLHNLEYANLFICNGPLLVQNWKNLRKLYYRNMETPVGIGELVWLQSLFYRVREKFVNESECHIDGIEELANLNSLEALAIMDLQNVKDPIDAATANLEGKHNLRELYLGWDEIEEDFGMWLDDRWVQKKLDQQRCDFQVFEALQPPTGLRHLVITTNFMGWELPKWMCVASSLLQLQHLELQGCRNIEQLPPAIGQLPRLRRLDLTRISLKSLEICGFPSLIVLHLTDMFVLEELCYSYPCLEELSISGCMRLTEIPSFPSLMTLVLKKIDYELVCSVGSSQTSLTNLCLENIDEFIYFPVSIFKNNCNLRGLVIDGCDLVCFGVDDDENENVAALFGPDLYNVSLQNLSLIDCPDLKYLPDLRGWTSLQELYICDCPNVKEFLTYDLKSLFFLKKLFVDFLQRNEQQGD